MLKLRVIKWKECATIEDVVDAEVEMIKNDIFCWTEFKVFPGDLWITWART